LDTEIQDNPDGHPPDINVGDTNVLEPFVLSQQENLCALWKPSGWSVTVGNEDAEQNSSESSDISQWVASYFCGQKIVHDDTVGHGLIHRLDRETSGILLCAMNYRGYYKAKLSFSTRSVVKEYLCLCHGWVPKSLKMLDRPLRKICLPGKVWRSIPDKGGKEARTEIVSITHLLAPGSCAVTLLKVRLHTGRMHQIRVHTSCVSHPLVGDSLYGSGIEAWCPRLFLHACRLSVPSDSGAFTAHSALPIDLQHAAEFVFAADGLSKALVLNEIGDLA